MQNNNYQGNNQQSFYNQPTQEGQPLPPYVPFQGNVLPPQMPFQGNVPPPPPIPGQFYNQPPAPTAQPWPYSRFILNIFIVLYVVFWIFCFIASVASSNAFATLLGRLGTSLLLGVLASILIMDWRGYTTIDSLVKWQQIRGSRRFWMLCVHIFFFIIVLGIYLSRKALSYSRSSHQALVAQWQVAAASRRPQVGLIVGTVIALLAFVSYSSSATLGASTPIASTSSTQVVGTTPYVVPTQKPTQVTLKATAIPTQVPTVAPTQPPVATPVPTQAPTADATQAPAKTGLNGNPWGYDLNPGNLIYNPPVTICDYFKCISSFWNNTNGYVDECADGMYSHSGGVHGACSRHGGEAQPLYSH